MWGDLGMVGEKGDQPTFIKVMDELTDVMVNLLINVFHESLELFDRKLIFPVTGFCFVGTHETNKNVFLEINSVEVREYDFDTFVFD